MLPGFSASSSLYRSRRAYAGYNASTAEAIQAAGTDSLSPHGLAVMPMAYRAGYHPTQPLPLWPWPHVFMCPPELTACGWSVTHWLTIPKECVDTLTDPNNCGECGNVCGPNQSCNDGVCGPDCCPDACPGCQCGPSPSDTDGVLCCPTGFYCCPLHYTASTTNSCFCARNGYPDVPMGCCTSCSG
jgi:hypothetical protein